MQLKRHTICLLVFVLGTIVAAAQQLPEKGVPLLRNFTPSAYQNKGKVWDIRSAPNGIVYMASDGGLLEYDGKTWRSYKGSNGIIRSLVVVNDSTMYSGSDLDFGVWKRNANQFFSYTSLYPFHEEENPLNEEFWDVHAYRDYIVFVSFQNIYVYKNKQLTKISAPSKFTGSFISNDSVYFADEKEGLFVLSRLALKQVFSYPKDVQLQITGLFHNAAGIVLITKNLGLYQYTSGDLGPLNSTLSDQLKSAKVFSFEQINGKYLAFGTILKGLYITDLKGNIIHWINRQKGLPNNTVLSIHSSPLRKLWLGMDFGVSALDLSNNLTYFYDYRGDFGTGSMALLQDSTFYLGTNQGLFYCQWTDLNNHTEFPRFNLLKGTEGQVWAIKNIDRRIFIGHDRGLFTLDKNAAQLFHPEPGVLTILPYKEYLLTGNYNGISIFRKSGDQWVFWKKMDLILGACNQLLIEGEDILWISIPSFGIIRTVLDDTLFPVDRKIFPEVQFEGNHARLIPSNKAVNVWTDKGQYVYNLNNGAFEFKPDVDAYLPIEGVLSSVYQADSLHPHYAFYPVYNGFALQFQKNALKRDLSGYTPIFRKMEALNAKENVLFPPGATIPYRLHHVKMEFIVPNQDKILYQYKLNESGEWSAWTSDNEFIFLGLREGKYTLFVRAHIQGATTQAATLVFRIAPPWYRSAYAYAGYILVLAALMYSFHFWRKASLESQRQKLLEQERLALQAQAEQHKHEIMLLEQEQLKKEYEQLKLQLKNKTIELAAKAKDDQAKSRLLQSIKEKLEDAQINRKIRWDEIQRLLDSHLDSEDKTFEIQMDELHQEFFKKLKERFPALTTQDLRLCAYLKIGLNSAEIANLMNIQPSSAYISRSRLRKKLNLTADEQLHDFLNAI